MRNTFSLALICVAVLIPLFQEGFSLRCHVCYSTKSWDDCVKNSRNITCHIEGVDDSSLACQTAHASRLGKNNQQFDIFYKSCVILEMCSKEKCRKEFIKPKDLNTTKASYCDLECCFRDDCNDMTSEAIALRFALSGASLTKSIADWLSSSFVYMMVSAVWRSIAQ